MNPEWRPTTLGEFLTLQRGFDLPAVDRKPGSIPVIASTGEVGRHNKARVRGPGVVIGRSGSVGGGQYIKGDYWPLNTTLWVKDFKGNHPRFCYYLLRSMSFAHLNGGTTVPTLNRNHVHPLPVSVPTVPAQRAIAAILGALDDKIELNRQMNRTLEEMAQAIFKCWFVDFDPVVAKAAGRQPFGMTAETASLFPDRFVESELGPIPKGWDAGSIAGLARFVNGRNFTKGASGNGRMVIRIAELNSGPGGSTAYSEVVADPENVAAPGDLLFSWSGSLDVYRWHRDEALINQHIFKVIPDSFPHWFIYFSLLEAMSFFQGIAAGKATTMGHIKREHLAQARVPLPRRSVVDAADAIIGPAYSLIHAYEREALVLAEIRDLLLPKVLSGEIRVRQAEALVEHAGV